MDLPRPLSALLKDPPPGLAFELSESAITVAKTNGKIPEFDSRPLNPGVISVSPLRDNVLLPDEFAAAVRGIIPQTGKGRRRDALVILPDYCARVSVLDFDSFPSDAKEQRALLRFRMKKSVPYDLDSAALSYWPQPNGKKFDVVVAVAPLEIVARYEAPFRAAGINPGMVTVSALASLDLVNETAVTVICKLGGRVLTVMVVESGRLKLVRSLELSDASVEEIAADLYPTFVYIEDNLEAKAEKLLLCGFGGLVETARAQFQRELEIEVSPVESRFGAPGPSNAGLMGYVHSVYLAARGVAA